MPSTLSTTEEVLFEVQDGIGIATLNRPQARNALTFAMYDRVAEICETTAAASGCRALIITGAGPRAFASGTDISEFKDFKTRDQIIAYEKHMDDVLDKIESCPVPTIAALSGACTGGGAAIAACCDLRIATSNMVFGFPIARTLGNTLSIQNLARIAALIGHARTKEILFTARLIPADEAQVIGLVSAVVEQHDALMSRAHELAATVAAHAPLTLKATKEAMRRLRNDGARANDEDLVTECYLSDDFKEGINAFLEKRPPQWTGK